MTLLDANVLLYAHNLESRHYQSVLIWLEKLTNTQEVVGFLAYAVGVLAHFHEPEDLACAEICR